MNRLSFFMYAALCAAVPLRTGAAQPVPADTLRGAVHAVDLRARTVDITAGVGMALRVVRLRLAADTRITEAGAPLALALLQPGDMVRVSWGSRASGTVAYTIERVGRLNAAPTGAP